MRVVWLVLTVFVLKCAAMTRQELDEFSDYLFLTSRLDLNVKKGSSADDDPFDEDETVSDHAWEDSGKFEGDLILNDRQRRLIVENVEGLSRNGLTDSTKRWPNNELVYFIQREHFNGDQVDAIERGIEDLAQASCVKFRPYRKGDRDAVVIQGSRRGCFAQVGYQGGFQVLNLSGRHPAGRGCFRHGTVVHELLHTLGFFHMQSSPDRDDYITVKWENILQPTRHNFRKYNSFSVSDFGVGYDYDSVLHYSRKAFSSNGKDTLVPKQSGVSIGQRIGLSDKDTQKLNKMYCDSNSNFELDEGVLKPTKKKKPKNPPFDGHGIGYQKGQTVVIKLPTTEDGKLPDLAAIKSIDPFRAMQPQSMPQEEVILYRGLQYPYTTEPTVKQHEIEMRERYNEDDDDDNERNKEIHWESLNGDPDSMKNYETFAEAYEKLSKKVYGADGYPSYDTDDSKHNLTSFESDESDENDETKFYAPTKPMKLPPNQNEEQKFVEALDEFEDTDSTYRTRMPYKKIYPKPVLMRFYKDKQRIKEQIQHSSIFSPATGVTSSEEAQNQNSGNYNPFAENDMEHKSTGYLPTGENDDPDAEKRKEYSSHKNDYDFSLMPYFGDSLRSAPGRKLTYNSHETIEYDESTESPRRRRVGHSLFGHPSQGTGSWYKPVYTKIESVSRPYLEK